MDSHSTSTTAGSRAILKVVLLLFVPTCQVTFSSLGCSRNPDLGVRLHPPRHVESSSRDATVHLSWMATDSTKDAEYNVYHSTRTNGPFVKVLTTRATQCDFPIADKHERIHYFCVTATLNHAAESDCSNQTAVESSAPLPNR
jgi:hypothetical protein